MSSKKKFEMSVLEEGYEDPFWKKVEEEKDKLNNKENKEDKDFENVNVNDILTTKRFAILIIWGILYKVSIYLGFGMMYIIF
jgi:hypothetical protein